VKTLYVGNLPFQTTEQDLVNWLSEAGVSGPSVKLIRDQMSGQLRGFGFVEVTNNQEADHAIQALNGQDFMGRNVTVNEARGPKEGGRGEFRVSHRGRGGHDGRNGRGNGDRGGHSHGHSLK